MGLFLRGVGLVLVGVILTMVVRHQRPDFAVLLSLGICCTVCLAGANYLSALTDLLGKIRSLGSLDRTAISAILKCAGIGFLGELAGLVCMDAGHSAMAKALQILASGAVIYLSIPLFEQLLDLMEEVLGRI